MTEARPGQIENMRLLWPSDQSVSLRGTTAILQTLDSGILPAGAEWPEGLDGYYLVNWLEPDGTFMWVESSGLSLDDLLRVIESLRPLTSQEWEDLKTSAPG